MMEEVLCNQANERLRYETMHRRQHAITKEDPGGFIEFRRTVKKGQ